MGNHTTPKSCPLHPGSALHNAFGILAIPCAFTLLPRRKNCFPLVRVVTDLHLMGSQKLDENPYVIQVEICASEIRAGPVYQVFSFN